MALQPLNYPTSRDYATLAKLAKEQAVVCFPKHKWNGGSTTDVAQTSYRPAHNDMEEVFKINARGICYIHAFGEQEFIEQCQQEKLEFLLPPSVYIQNIGSEDEGEGEEAFKAQIIEMDSANLSAQMLTQQGAIHMASTLLNVGANEENTRDALASLRRLAQHIREELTRRGLPVIFETDSLA